MYYNLEPGTQVRVVLEGEFLGDWMNGFTLKNNGQGAMSGPTYINGQHIESVETTTKYFGPGQSVKHIVANTVRHLGKEGYLCEGVYFKYGVNGAHSRKDFNDKKFELVELV